MKKALFVLLALFVVGAFVFADAPTAGSFHAWNRGVFIPYIQYGSNAASAGWAPPWDNNKGIDQEWTFSYDGAGYGFSATVEWGGDNFFGAGSAPTSSGLANAGATNQAYGAYSWFDTYYNFGKYAQIMLGKPRITQFSQFSPIEGVGISGWNNVATSDWLTMLQLYPTSGAVLAGGLYLPENAANAGALGAFANAQAGTSPNFGNNWFVAAQYSMPNMATVNAFLKMQGDFGGSTATTKVFNINANVSAIPNLPIVAWFAYDFTNTSFSTIHGMLGITDNMGPLTLKLEGAILSESTSPSLTSVAGQGQVDYVVSGPYSVGVILGYDDGKGVNWFDWGTGDWAGFELYPYVMASYANGSRIKLSFLYATGAGTGSQVVSTEQDATTAVTIDYIWSF